MDEERKDNGGERDDEHEKERELRGIIELLENSPSVPADVMSHFNHSTFDADTLLQSLSDTRRAELTRMLRRLAVRRVEGPVSVPVPGMAKNVWWPE